VPYEVRYGVVIDEFWRTRSVGVHVQRPGPDNRLAVVADEEGGWSTEEEPLRAVAGCRDVDLAFTPATNTLAIRRLGLEVGEGADLEVTYVQFPELAVSRLEQRYDRLAEDRYLYRNPGFSAELRVGADGLVVDYAGRWETVARADLPTVAGEFSRPEPDLQD
jgi:hypothetical protein